MPPHLHPRSTATSTLFAGTLLASFVVVAIPHLVPCPRPNARGQLNSEIQFDENGKPIRRARKATSRAETGAVSQQRVPVSNNLQDEAVKFKQLQAEAEVVKQESKDRECPVPKPSGVLGRWLGFDAGKYAVKD